MMKSKFTVFFVNHSTGALASIQAEAEYMFQAQSRFVKDLRQRGLLTRGQKYKITVCNGDRPLDDFPVYLFSGSLIKTAR